MTPEDVRGLLLTKKTERDKQRSVGPSEIGGCRRKVWHRIQNTPQTNLDTFRLASTLGTAIHTWIESALAKNDRFILETRVERNGLVGHVDCYDVDKRQIVDWKTIKLSGLPYFPSKQQRWQVHVYGWLMSESYPVDEVCLVGLPRDGTDRDIVTHVEPYDEGIAAEALAWLEDVRGRSEPPKPEKPAAKFCRFYCNYYDPTGVVGCTGQ